MTSRIFLALSLVAPLATAACTDTVEDEFLQDDVVDVDDSKSDISGGTYTFYTVTRDLRRCASPFCGGYWIKRVNASTTKCHDGRYAESCYVATLDSTRLGLEEAALSKVEGAINSAFSHGPVLLRGVFTRKDWGANLGYQGEFRATEAWLGQGPNLPEGPFAMAEDTGVRCFTFPCNSIREKKLNSSATAYLAEIGWDDSGADDELIGTAATKLVDDAVIIAGDRYSVRGPGGRGKARSATQFYFRAVDEVQAECVKTGCSGQICADENVFSTCEFRPEYACYREATCERQDDGTCGWTETAELSACLANPPQPE
jgi:hypothetical protein